MKFSFPQFKAKSHKIDDLIFNNLDRQGYFDKLSINYKLINVRQKFCFTLIDEIEDSTQSSGIV